jgi:uncharacterized iron-regulated membrane protein
MWIRRVNFQVHLWVGIVLALYMIVMGVTGSVLVFSVELETMCGRKPWHSMHASEPFADIASVLHNLRTAYPNFSVIRVMAPVETDPTFEAVLEGRNRIRVALDPTTGAVLGEFPKGLAWLSAVQTLHVSLFVQRNGRILNGIGAAFLLLMCITGLVNWWPGVRNWRRALKLNFRRSWRRINYDLHSAAGFWTVAIIAFWAISGIYFAWPRQVFGLVNRVSPIVTAKPPIVTVMPGSAVAGPDLDRIVERASAIDPAAKFRGVIFPFSRRAPLEILMRRGKGLGREYEDTLYFDPYSGEHLATWQYGINKSLGDWFIWSQVPLHFGVYWGLGVKIVWAVLGLVIPILAVTGLLMYWNRTLRKKWKRLNSSGLRAEPQSPPV